MLGMFIILGILVVVVVVAAIVVVVITITAILFSLAAGEIIAQLCFGIMLGSHSYY